MDLKQNAATKIYFRIKDSNNQPVTDLTTDDVVISIFRYSEDSYVKSLSGPDFVEDANVSGVYRVALSTSDVGIKGPFLASVAWTQGAASGQVDREHNVVDFTAADTIGAANNAASQATAAKNRIGVPDVDLVTQLDDMTTVIQSIKTATDNLPPDPASVTSVEDAARSVIDEISAELASADNTEPYFHVHDFTYDANGRQLTATKDIYDTKANALVHDGSTGLVKRKTVQLEWSNGRLVSVLDVVQ